MITLAEALSLRAMLGKRIGELIAERNSAAFIDVNRDDISAMQQVEEQSKLMKQLNSQLDKVRHDYRILDFLIAKANVENTILFESSEYPICMAIELAKHLRDEANRLRNFGVARSCEINKHAFVDGAYLLRMVAYDPEEYKKMALTLEKKAAKLSTLIEATNHNIMIGFDASEYLD